MKILTVVGARPQFIKAACVSRIISARRGVEEVIVHTGQHFDRSMSDSFFDQLDIPKPRYNLGISDLNHGAMTGKMLSGIEELIQKERPDWMLVYGDTNSTLAGALAAVKQGLPVAHVEAGLRSNNMAMPEEINRILTDRVSGLLLCPTQAAVANLEQERFPFFSAKNQVQRLINVGDVMFDAVLHYKSRALEISLGAFGVQEKGYILCTLHRQENTDNDQRLIDIVTALKIIAKDSIILFPLHPRTRHRLKLLGMLEMGEKLIFLDPLPYLHMQRLQMGASIIMTDSGGIQKEAYFHRVPCITLRDETEWVETLRDGSNQLVGADIDKILSATSVGNTLMSSGKNLFGDGHSAEKIVTELTR